MRNTGGILAYGLALWLVINQISFASQAGKEFNDADAALNTVYQTLLASIDNPQQRTGLIQSQRAWIKYRDDNVAFFATHYPNSKGGLFLNIRLTQDRTAFLQSMLDAPPNYGMERIPAAIPQVVPDYFPLQKGNYWIYRGETKFLVRKAGSNENVPKSEVLTWKMEVADTFTYDRLFAALIKGAPFDLDWYEPDRPRGDYLILRVGATAYYLYSGDKAKNAWKNLHGDSPDFGMLEKEGDLILDTPLLVGKVWGSELMHRSHGRYCWLVEGEHDFNPKNFPSAGVVANTKDYTLAYRTSPDHQILDFVPGLGIVGYEYVHHGTLAETRLCLIEFGKAKSEQRH